MLLYGKVVATFWPCYTSCIIQREYKSTDSQKTKPKAAHGLPDHFHCPSWSLPSELFLGRLFILGHLGAEKRICRNWHTSFM